MNLVRIFAFITEFYWFWLILFIIFALIGAYKHLPYVEALQAKARAEKPRFSFFWIITTIIWAIVFLAGFIGKIINK